jgi:hypothetical protein
MSQQSLPMTPKLLLMISRHIDNVSWLLSGSGVVADGAGLSVTMRAEIG